MRYSLHIKTSYCLSRCIPSFTILSQKSNFIYIQMTITMFLSCQVSVLVFKSTSPTDLYMYVARHFTQCLQLTFLKNSLNLRIFFFLYYSVTYLITVYTETSINEVPFNTHNLLCHLLPVVFHYTSFLVLNILLLYFL